MQGEEEFTFWHILVRDVAYAQIPRAQRAARHLKAAGWIERAAGERVGDHADILAHHYLQAIELGTDAAQDPAVRAAASRYLHLAGDRAGQMDKPRAVELYRGGIRARSERAMAEAPTTRAAIEVMLRSAVRAATEPNEPRGCLIVQGALACSPSSDNVQEYLHQLRLETHKIVTRRIKAGVAAGDVPARTDLAALAGFYTTFIHGLLLQARDGVSRAALMTAVDYAMTSWATLVRE